MAKRFLSIWFPQLICDSYCVQHPAQPNTALLAIWPQRNKMMVKACNHTALAQGLRPGMSLADCRAIQSNIITWDYQENEEQESLFMLGLSCLQFTPTVSIDAPDGLLLDISGCAHLWQDENNYSTTIKAHLNQLGYQCSLGLADTIGCAWAAARYSPERINIISPAKQESFLAELPPAALRIPDQIQDSLSKLGFKQVKDFSSLTASTLRKRFGPILNQQLNIALGKSPETLQAIAPPKAYEVVLESLEPIQTRIGIEIALEKLCFQLCKALEQDHKGLRKAEFSIKKIDHNQESISIGTHQNTRQPKHLFQLLLLKIDKIKAEPGIEFFSLKAVMIGELSIQSQTLWTDINHDTEALATLLDRISQKIGSQKISRQILAQQHWPENAIKKVNNLHESSHEEANNNKPRPILLLQQPEAIEVMVALPDYPPLQFKHQGCIHKVMKADGPERIEAQWWLQEGLHRDYYSVENEKGARYWIYRLGHYNSAQPQWFLHGLFA